MSHKRTFSSIVLSTLIILSISFAQPKSAAAQGSDGLRRQVNAQSGKVSFIVPANGRSLSAAKALGISPSARLADPAKALINRFAPEFGLRSPERELTEIDVKNPGDGRVTVRYQQNYQGIPVLGGELILNTNENGDLYSINGEVSSSFSLQTQPTIDSEQARRTALQSMAKWYQTTTDDFVASDPTLWIYDESLLQPSTRPAELVWRMEVTAVNTRMPVRELVLINAERGNISLHFNQVDTAWRVPNPASTTRARTPETSSLQAAGAVVKTYTAGNSTTLPGTFLCDQTAPNCPSGDSHAKAAHKYAIGTYNFYQTEHGRVGIDNNNMPVISTVHYDFGYQNAFWSGSQMVYGDGYGFSLADDVVAHELTHGVTQHESNLFYYYQSGAINESFSDLWGEYYDQINGQGNDNHGSGGVKWLIGENITGLGAIRSMSNPPAFSNPDKMSSLYYYEFSGDNGGVHFNSGVNNKAVYLMVDGGTFNGKTVTALGWAKTAAIYYEVHTNLLPSGADYSDLFFALQQACSNLTGQKGITSSDCQEVKDAIEAVEMHLQPAPNFNTDAPLCDAGTPSITFAEDLENGAGKWTFSNGGTTRWQIDSPFYGPYAQSGIHSLYADDFPAAIADVNARLAPFTVPSNSYLHFSHAFDFESFGDPFNFDGGVLEYSTNGGSTWLDAGPLINFNGYKGTIYNDWTNPLKGRSGFVGSSHGYISTRLDLSSLAGQTVTFRWRMGLDDIGFAWGWWVDNIKVYTCIVGNWDVRGVGSFSHGTGTDIPVPADYNGDGKDDLAMFRESTSTWDILGVGSFMYGTTNDTPVVGDYNGDGKDDIAVFRPSNGTWYIRGIGAFPFGTTGDLPVVGDYNGDGRADIAVFRPSNSTWHLHGIGSFVYGTTNDIPVVGDYNGDGKDDIAVFRPSNGTWYIRGIGAFPFGTTGDLPVVGDYNGDGRADIAVFRPSNSTWYIHGIGSFVYGTTSDIPVVGDYNGDGKDDIAVFHP